MNISLGPRSFISAPDLGRVSQTSGAERSCWDWVVPGRTMRWPLADTRQGGEIRDTRRPSGEMGASQQGVASPTHTVWDLAASPSVGTGMGLRRAPAGSVCYSACQAQGRVCLWSVCVPSASLPLSSLPSTSLLSSVGLVSRSGPAGMGDPEPSLRGGDAGGGTVLRAAPFPLCRRHVSVTRAVRLLRVSPSTSRVRGRAVSASLEWGFWGRPQGPQLAPGAPWPRRVLGSRS